MNTSINESNNVNDARWPFQLNATDSINTYKSAIAEINRQLDTRFFSGERISNLVHDRAAFMDTIIHQVWQRFEWDNHISLLAVGGYGRGELHPQSDIDLLLLVRRGNPKRYKKNIEGFITFLWDLQLANGHSVRSLSQCADEAAKDLTIATSLMETRTIAGDERLRESMLKKVNQRSIWPIQTFFSAKCEEQNTRYEKHGNTEYNLEPNIKEAPGGLRDLQTLGWVAKKHFNVNSTEELVGKNFLSAEEYLILKRSEAFLWKVRYALHTVAQRPEERLLFEHQRKIAEILGYEDSNEKLGVEKFMQRYYRVVLSIRELNDVLLQYLDDLILRNNKNNTDVTVINSRFQVRDNHIETVNPFVFAKNPSSLLEIFCLLGENENIEGIRASTIREIRLYRALIDDDFRNQPENKALFLRLLRCPHKMSTQLQRMTRYGILGTYLPEFGKIIGQTQHDLFHRYPVDAHTLQLIKNMRLLDRPDVAAQYPEPAHVYKNLVKPELAFIAGLFHDIGKGRGGDHSTLGAVDAESFCQLHGLSEEETKLVTWLVSNHLLMSSTSQREDTSDPDIIHKFAKVVGTEMYLNYLYVLTVADITATNPTLWTSWKAALMRQLYSETKRALQRGLTNPIDRKAWVQNTRQTAINLVSDLGIQEQRAREIWDDLDDEFFLREKAEDICRYTAAIAVSDDEQGAPVIVIKDAGVEVITATQIFIYTSKIENVFPTCAATLDKLRLNIQDARLHRNGLGNRFYTFYVLDENNKPFGDNESAVEKVKQTLKKALLNSNAEASTTNIRVPRDLKHFTLRTETVITNDDKLNVTILEVISPDRPGLLAHLGDIFIRFKLRLLHAKIATLGERVEDIFHIVDYDYQPLHSEMLREKLRDTICRELDARNKHEAPQE